LGSVQHSALPYIAFKTSSLYVSSLVIQTYCYRFPVSNLSPFAFPWVGGEQFFGRKARGVVYVSFFRSVGSSLQKLRTTLCRFFLDFFKLCVLTGTSSRRLFSNFSRFLCSPTKRGKNCNLSFCTFLSTLLFPSDILFPALYIVWEMVTLLMISKTSPRCVLSSIYG